MATSTTVSSIAIAPSPGVNDMSVDLVDISMTTAGDDEESIVSNAGGPSIRIRARYRDWCVLQLSRGTGPRAGTPYAGQELLQPSQGIVFMCWKL